MSAETFYAALGVDLKGRSNGNAALRCLSPDHEDHRASASASLETGAWNCHACGEKGGAYRAAVLLGLTTQDAAKLVDDHGLWVGERRNGDAKSRTAKIVATYDYTDEHGGLLFQAQRRADKSFTQRRPDPENPGEWVYKLGNTRRVLYRLPKVVEAVKAGAVIYVAEGEKDVHALEKVGVVATCNPMGAEKWREEYTDTLAGAANVVIVQDRDDAGRKHAEKVRAALNGKVRGLAIVQAKEGHDAHDHLAAGHGVGDFVPVRASEPTPNGRPGATVEPEPESGRRVVSTRMTDVDVEVPRWAWRGRIPLRNLSIVAGRESLGKSTLLLEIVARATRGTLEGDLNGEPVDVLLVTYEDGIATTVLPRLMAAGADLSRVHTLTVTEDGYDGLVSLPGDLEEIERHARRVGAKLIIVDPIMAALDGKIDAHRDQDSRRALAPLAKLAEKLDLAVVAVMHFNKGAGTDAALRTGGSIGFVAAARSHLAFGRDPDDPEGERGVLRVLAHTECNVGPLAPSLRYRVEGRSIQVAGGGTAGTSRVVELGECDVASSELLATSGGAEECSALDEATDFLEAELDKPQSAVEVGAKSKRLGISDATLRRARGRLGVKAAKTGFEGGWEWSIQTPPHEGAQRGSSTSGRREGEHLREKPLGERDSGATGTPDTAEGAHVTDVSAFGAEGASKEAPDPVSRSSNGMTEADLDRIFADTNPEGS